MYGYIYIIKSLKAIGLQEQKHDSFLKAKWDFESSSILWEERNLAIKKMKVVNI